MNKGIILLMMLLLAGSTGSAQTPAGESQPTDTLNPSKPPQAAAEDSASKPPQPSSPDTLIRSEEIDVVKPYRPRLAEAVKINNKPKTPDITVKKEPLSYEVPQKLLELEYSPPAIRPLVMKKPKPAPLQNGYIKAGFGNYTTPYLDGWYNNGRSQPFSYGAHVGYLSSKGSLEHQEFRDIEADIYGKFQMEKNALSAKAAYLSQTYHYYGYDNQDTSFTQGESRQILNKASGKVSFYNTFNKIRDLDYTIDLRGYDLSAETGETEYSLTLLTDVRKQLQDNQLTVDLKANLNSFSDTSGKDDQQIISLNPRFLVRKLGLTLGFDLTLETGQFHPFPDIGFEKPIVKHYLIFYNGWQKWLKQYRYHELIIQNPWLSQGSDLQNAIMEDRYAGIKGSFSGRTSYNVGFSQKIIKSMPLFLNDTIDDRKFNVIYETSATLIEVKGEFSYQVNEKFSFLLSGAYWQYELQDEISPWHLPDIRINGTLSYAPVRKFRLELSGFYWDGMTYLSDGKDVDNLPSIVDINLSAHYQHSKNLTFFTALNNLAARSYQRWHNYPTLGFNGIAGLAFSF